MSEVQTGNGVFTINSHGKELARQHMHDWLVLVLLASIDLFLNIIEPFHRYVAEDMMTDMKYPFYEKDTIPMYAVPVYAGILPIGIFLIYYMRRKDVYDLHHAMLGLLYALLITAVLTDSIKDATGRPRPNFFYRCFPDGKAAFTDNGDVLCHGDAHKIKEGYKSFPSGHTSWSFAGLGFLALYLCGKLRAFSNKGHARKLCIVVSPYLFAALVGVSRVDDYWHHWTDVFTGAIIGTTVASFCYLQFFPFPNAQNVMERERVQNREVVTAPLPDLEA
ncbi:phosphatidic acid phosphatase type 2/haloperoxidase, Lipid phosphate phosphatase [Artemisia annua]|uniref:Phosphatidic acid phosphatase type 2/haloperoxidase, Lipid phosphate phosphatase n=1 Tax=Artemisia annua TaxID=35608 RepID=A0A2U1KXK0_ARTAN|nr:phosphatidic acid phosphatase type 2/haloperoxidase, Lipid phosphate phosphatase [Artemisia annua]